MELHIKLLIDKVLNRLFSPWLAIAEKFEQLFLFVPLSVPEIDLIVIFRNRHESGVCFIVKVTVII
jgi:hypothetical protein